MCVMEVRIGQRSSTIAQACAHNVSTVERDLDMYEKLLLARGETTVLAAIRGAHVQLRSAYAQLLDAYGTEVAVAVRDHHDHDDHGTERSFMQVVDEDIRRAKRYETR